MTASKSMLHDLQIFNFHVRQITTEMGSKSSNNHRPDKVALYSALLGLFAGINAVLGPAVLKYWQLPTYFACLALFHFLEYYITARYNPTKVSLDSFLFRNGNSYFLAHALATSEAIGSLWLTPSMTGLDQLSLFGLFLVVLGQLVRSLAMIHASSNFSHIIETNQRQSHELVTTGIYSISRHPSYMGYFLWAIATQILLLNPISLVVFTVVLWRFFRHRIIYEENYLVELFGQQYLDYRARVRSGIPFIP
ncbi:Isoprenylcysteine carboxyl methyltransferase family-domain-containing protein [Lipomyces oligophaga]|uniref:Isoprenylcysteine carboxyl methyltransferase family-domain-containing protein n=1 Tax=Lipomyces oligophaga TaxID=45792 RepID=UPI0034CEF09E